MPHVAVQWNEWIFNFIIEKTEENAHEGEKENDENEHSAQWCVLHMFYV